MVECARVERAHTNTKVSVAAPGGCCSPAAAAPTKGHVPVHRYQWMEFVVQFTGTVPQNV